MLSFILKIVKNIVLKLATTGAFSFLQPWLLKVDAWCEEKLGIDLIVQEKKFFEKAQNSKNFQPQPSKSDKSFFDRVKEMFS